MNLKPLKYYQLILGCQMNRSDAERIASFLDTLGFKKTEKEEEANLIAVQACSIRQSAIDRIHSRIHKWMEIKKKRTSDHPLVTLLTGCVLPRDRKVFSKQFDLFIETDDVPKEFAQKLAILLPQFNFAYISEDRRDIKSKDVTSDDFFALKPNYTSTFQAYIPIQAGCNNFCTFCAVPYTKGRERYRPNKDIVHEIEHLIDRGYKEITLLGQNVNTYFDPTLKDALGKRTRYREWNALTDFPRLLRTVNDIKGNFWVRFLTSNPWDMSDETIKAVADCEKVCEYIHLPMQSGSDKILKAMNRHHTQKHYLELIDKIRAAIPGVAITTDVIVGFPGETEEDFMEIVKAMQYVGYDMAYLARYSPRPGTIAERYFKDDVPREEKKRREKYLEEILRKSALKANKKYVGKEVEVLVENVKYQHPNVKSISKSEIQ
ncbi:MAG TPA: tRNA (N6-isopentenyl adenosine(37)-C2)-methylthiotransferase MiaB, partial [Candidatus Jacksonbacteria bacterium]|nr:tRNA (N6-isopentenyl adenosine(37)-C2)-methylthiotransferase MiaB [Candidatus Jacksonbacteria bacterium]